MKTMLLKVRITLEERERLSLAALEEKVTVSEYVRRRLFDEQRAAAPVVYEVKPVLSHDTTGTPLVPPTWSIGSEQQSSPSRKTSRLCRRCQRVGVASCEECKGPPRK